MTPSPAVSVVRQAPRLTPTVVPGQLPMVTLEPVRALKRVDLPEFGAPTRATMGEPTGADAEFGEPSDEVWGGGGGRDDRTGTDGDLGEGRGW